MKKVLLLVVLVLISLSLFAQQPLPDAPKPNAFVRVVKSPYTFEKNLWSSMTKEERYETLGARLFWLGSVAADDRTTVVNLAAGSCIETNAILVQTVGNRPTAGQLAVFALIEGAIAMGSEDVLMKLLHGAKLHPVAHALPVVWGAQHLYGGAWHNWKLRQVCGVK